MGFLEGVKLSVMISAGTANVGGGVQVVSAPPEPAYVQAGGYVYDEPGYDAPGYDAPYGYAGYDDGHYDDFDYGDATPFVNDLAPYGRFVNHAQFGIVFVPARSNYQPYRNGRWVHSNHGLTWQSYEPFGWVVEHYGRWVFTRRFGWVWIPGRQWAPAWVEWRSYGDYVAWAPMAPTGVTLQLSAFHCVPSRRLFHERLNGYYVRTPRWIDRGHRHVGSPDRVWLRRHRLPERTIQIPVRHVDFDRPVRPVRVRDHYDPRLRDQRERLRDDAERRREDRQRLRDDAERRREDRQRRLEDAQRRNEVRTYGTVDPDAAYRRRLQQQDRREAQQLRRDEAAERRADQQRRRAEARARRGGWGVRPDIDARDRARDARDRARDRRDVERDARDRGRDRRDRQRDRRYFGR